MDGIYREGTALAIWYDYYIVLGGFVIALGLALLTGTRGRWSGPGLFVNTVMVLALLAGLPLMMTRLGIDMAITNFDVVGYMSLAGTAVSLIVGLLYLLGVFIGTRKASVGDDFRADTPVQGIGATGEASGEQTSTLGQLADQQATVMGGQAPVHGGTPSQLPAAWLYIKTGPMAGQTIPISSGRTSIGRGSDNDIILDDPTVSRNHATITYADGGFVIEDSGSVSGTMVEGASARRTRLSSGASVMLGDTEAVFMEGEMRIENSAEGRMASKAGAGSEGLSETRMISRENVVLAWLAVTNGPDKGKSYQLKVGANTIGRAPDNDLSISDTSMSRHHSMIRVEGDEYMLADLGSRGGTTVGEQRLGGKELRMGGSLEIGESRLSLIEVESRGGAVPETMSGETMVAQPGSGKSGVLVVQSGPSAGESFSLIEGDNVIGRDPNECSIVLGDESVSRTHALIRREGERFIAFDLGSKTGTKVNGEELRGHRLSAGERIKMGQSEVVLMKAGGS